MTAEPPPRASARRRATSRLMLAVESNKRLSSDSIGLLCSPPLLDAYLASSVGHTFSELIFRLTHEVFDEESAAALWHQIASHRAELETHLARDVGMLVAALDYLSNITNHMASPKIIDDDRMEDAALMATRDPMTGLYLRSLFEFSLDRMVREHLRFGKDLCLLLLDIDRFKHINDSLGHMAGDSVLRRIGSLILQGVRESDLPARYGGDELVILFPETTLARATELAHRLQEDVRRCFAGSELEVTVSLGLSHLHAPDILTRAQLVSAADEAMYAAKRAEGSTGVGGCRADGAARMTPQPAPPRTR